MIWYSISMYTITIYTTFCDIWWRLETINHGIFWVTHFWDKPKEMGTRRNGSWMRAYVKSIDNWGEIPLASWIPRSRGQIWGERDQGNWDSRQGESSCLLPSDHMVTTLTEALQESFESRHLFLLRKYVESPLLIGGKKFAASSAGRFLTWPVSPTSSSSGESTDDPRSTVFCIRGWCTTCTARVLYKYSIIQSSRSVFFHVFPWFSA